MKFRPRLLVPNLGLNDFYVGNDKSVVMDIFVNQNFLLRKLGLNDFYVVNDKSVVMDIFVKQNFLLRNLGLKVLEQKVHAEEAEIGETHPHQWRITDHQGA